MKNKIIITIEGYKFDITSYVDQHPGGAFNAIKGHDESTVIDMLDKFCIGKA